MGRLPNLKLDSILDALINQVVHRQNPAILGNWHASKDFRYTLLSLCTGIYSTGPSDRRDGKRGIR